MTLLMEDLFWSYLVERENIRLRRLRGEPREAWTEDWIMRAYSFTNVKRRHDRTTTLLVHEFYDRHELTHPSPVALLNATIFRYHGTIETARAVGWHDDWSVEVGRRMADLNEWRRDQGQQVFTGSYIIPSAGSTDPKTEVVRIVVNQVWEHADMILATESWEEACRYMKRRLWNVGMFMAKEVMLDYMLVTGWRPTDWQTWTPVGPGARRGAGVVLHDEIRKVSESATLDVCRQLHARQDERWPHDVKLDLTDVQFALCELAKYRKAQTGEGRPKRLFHPTVDDVTKATYHTNQMSHPPERLPPIGYPIQSIKFFDDEEHE